VALLVAALIFVIGLGIGYLGLWALSVAFWVVGFSYLGIAVTALWAFIVYGTKIVVAYLFAAWVLEKILPAAFRYRALALLLGTLVYTLLVSIPFAGWVIDVLVTAAGMGAAWLAYRHSRTPPQPVKKRSRKVVVVVVEPETP